MTEQDRVAVDYAVESRDGPLRMRFPVDPDTTARLQRLKLDTNSKLPLWRRIMRWVFRI
jgi:hypothetical protein